MRASAHARSSALIDVPVSHGSAAVVKMAIVRGCPRRSATSREGLGKRVRAAGAWRGPDFRDDSSTNAWGTRTGRGDTFSPPRMRKSEGAVNTGGAPSPEPAPTAECNVAAERHAVSTRAVPERGAAGRRGGILVAGPMPLAVPCFFNLFESRSSTKQV